MEMEPSFRICKNSKCYKRKLNYSKRSKILCIWSVRFADWFGEIFTKRENRCKNEPVWKSP